MLLGQWQSQRLRAKRMHIAQRAASNTVEMVVIAGGVGVIAARTVARRDLAHFAHLDKFVQGVVNGREAYLGKARLRFAVDGLGGEMNMVTSEHLCHDTSLRREAPSPIPQPCKQRANDLLRWSATVTSSVIRPVPYLDAF